MMRMTVLVVLPAAILCGCGDSGSSSSTVPAATGMAEHLKAAGAEIKEAAKEGAAKMEPAMEKGADEVRKEVHTGAAWVEEKTKKDATSTAPTQP